MKLVLLDLDNTLVDANYCLTSPEEEFCDMVVKLAKKNVHIGLCSDSAIITLRQWTDRLDLTGPIIGERGAVIWNSTLQTDSLKNEFFISPRFQENLFQTLLYLPNSPQKCLDTFLPISFGQQPSFRG